MVQVGRVAGVDEMFGRYRLRGLLGAGGMGQVFRAYDTELDREVAIKVLAAQASTDASFEQRFRREARIAASLDEPHVVPIHDSGEIDGRLFIAMRLINGTDVASLLARSGPMSPAQAVDIIEQAAAALDAAHDVGLVHRDVKPANLLVTPKSFVYLIDFGIARAPGATQLTSTGAAIGTVAYMAPERFTTGVADNSADIYALACVLHECLTGTKPYPDTSIEQQMFAHVHAPRPQPSRVRPGIPAGFDAVIATGMATDPQHRYRGAGELARAARTVIENTPAAAYSSPTPASPTPISPATLPRHHLPADPAYTAIAPATPAPVRPAVAPARSATPPARPRSRRRLLVGLAVAAVLILATATAIAVTNRDHNPPALTVTATIEVGGGPSAVAVDPTTHTAYVTNHDDGTVSVIDTTTDTVTTTINVGGDPRGVAIDPTTHTAYITNSGDTVSVIDTATNTVTTTINVGSNPWGVAVDPTTHTAYITNSGEHTVSVIDTTANTVTTTINVDLMSQGVAVDPTTHTAYVTNLTSGTVSVIDTTTNTVTTTIYIGSIPQGVAVDPTTHTAYATNFNGGTVSVIDTTTNTVTTTIEVGNLPSGVAVDPDAHTAYITNTRGSTVSVIDTTTNTVTTTINVGPSPADVAVDTTTHTAYVTNTGNDTVSVIAGP